MIQKGKTWQDKDGNDIPVSYIPKSTQALEALSNKLTKQAEMLEPLIQQSKDLMVAWMKEALTIINADPQRSKTTDMVMFYSFDGQYRFEYLQKRGYVRVQRAKKANARHDQFIPLNFDFSRAIVGGMPVIDESPNGDNPAFAKFMVWLHPETDEVGISTIEDWAETASTSSHLESYATAITKEDAIKTAVAVSNEKNYIFNIKSLEKIGIKTEGLNPSPPDPSEKLSNEEQAAMGQGLSMERDAMDDGPVMERGE